MFAGKGRGAKKNSASSSSQHASTIDFRASISDASIEALLKAGPPSTTLLSSVSEKAALKNNHLLPEDLHYTISNLFELFTKPRVLVRLRFHPWIGIASARNTIFDGIATPCLAANDSCASKSSDWRHQCFFKPGPARRTFIDRFFWKSYCARQISLRGASLVLKIYCPSS